MSGPPYDLFLANGRLVLHEGVFWGGLAVSQGRIARILPLGEEVPARTVRDVFGLHVLPGLVDSHVHFRTPGLTHKETWSAASRAAVAGGVTTVIDMPNTEPPLVSPDAIPQKAEEIGPGSLVDYSFHLGVLADDIEVLESVHPTDAASVKVFMAGHHTAPHVVEDPATLARIFAIAARRDLLLTLHAEDNSLFGLLERVHPSPNSLTEYEAARPRAGGIAAVARVIGLVREYGTRTHVLHVSSAEEVDLLTAAARAGLPVTFEVTPHHLTFSAENAEQLGARAKISPALRTEADRARLWEAVLGGIAKTVGSDHAPHSLEEKSHPFAEAPPGLPGVQEMMPALLTGIATHRPHASASERALLLAKLCASAPAELFGLDHRKGRLAPGLDADIVVLNMDREWEVKPEDLHSLCGWSAYEGLKLRGVPVLTLRRGEAVYEDGRFGAGGGAFVRPRPERTVPLRTGENATEQTSPRAKCETQERRR